MISPGGHARFCGNCPLSETYCGNVDDRQKNMVIGSTALQFCDQDGGVSAVIGLGGEFDIDTLTDDEKEYMILGLKSTLIRRIGDCVKGVANPRQLYDCPALDEKIIGTVLRRLDETLPTVTSPSRR